MVFKDSFLTFLRDLDRNNNREWFNENKSRYEAEVKDPFLAYVGQVVHRAHHFDPHLHVQPKDAVYRIYRDTRFSADKRPYKTHVAALISRYGTRAKEYPGMYIHIEPGRLMLGGGAYFLEKDSLYKVREHIAQHSDQFMALLHEPAFVSCYGEVRGERNKIVPAEFRDLCGKVPYLANKQFYFMAELPAETILKPDFLEITLRYYLAGKPLCDFLKEALYGPAE